MLSGLLDYSITRPSHQNDEIGKCRSHPHKINRRYVNPSESDSVKREGEERVFILYRLSVKLSWVDTQTDTYSVIRRTLEGVPLRSKYQRVQKK